jgi:hypothetical protein
MPIVMLSSTGSLMEFSFLLFFLIIADMLETRYPQAYLSGEANGKNLLAGAAASSYFDATAELYVNTLTKKDQKKKNLSHLYTLNYHLFQKFKLIKIGKTPNT